jgi:hypothetical protein
LQEVPCRDSKSAGQAADVDFGVMIGHWIGVLLLMLGLIGCERRSNQIDYRGEKIKLTKAYANYDDYKNDPENIDPSETERVQRLVLGAPIATTFGSRLEAAKAIGQIAFPGYGSGGFVEQSQADGSVLMGFSVEVPRAGKERYFVFKARKVCIR